MSAGEAKEATMESPNAQLLHLEQRMVAAEQKWMGCEKAVMEMGSQLESKLAVLGTILEENSLLQRRLENLESLLKNQNFWILRFPPGFKGEIPKVTLSHWSGLIQSRVGTQQKRFGRRLQSVTGLANEPSARFHSTLSLTAQPER